MFYFKFGDLKKVVVFLHGWGSDSSSFLWTRDYFDYCSTVFVDFPGFGKSDEPAHTWSVLDYVNSLKEVLDGIEIDELILVGHSFGGRIAIKFGACYQNLYKKFRICLIDSAGILPHRSILYKIKVARYKKLKQRKEQGFDVQSKIDSCGSDDYKKLSPVMKQTFVKVVNEDLSSDAKRLNCDCLIIWGKRDKETKLYMARKLNAIIKKSKLVILEKAGHFSFLDRKEEFLILLDTFIKNL